MSEDREMLELAAKAAGIVIKRSRLDDPMTKDFLVVAPQPNANNSAFVGWNPLTDDGDALRLAVKLGIGTRHHEGWSQAFQRDAGIFDFYHDSDVLAATRRAIVRTAAAIGKAQP